MRNDDDDDDDVHRSLQRGTVLQPHRGAMQAMCQGQLPAADWPELLRGLPWRHTDGHRGRC